MNAVAVWAIPGHEAEALEWMRNAGFTVADGTTHWLLPVTGGTYEQACEAVEERFDALDPKWREFVTVRRQEQE